MAGTNGEGNGNGIHDTLSVSVHGVKIDLNIILEITPTSSRWFFSSLQVSRL